MSQPVIHKRIEDIGNLSAKIEGEQFDDSPILDTKVEIEEGILCWITWADKDDFFRDINDVINKYRI